MILTTVLENLLFMCLGWDQYTWSMVILSCWGRPAPYLELFWVRRSWVGPVYLVIFSCWGGPVPYLELFWVGAVKKNHPVLQLSISGEFHKHLFIVIYTTES